MNIEIKNPSSVYRLGVAVVAVAVLISLFAVIMPQLSARSEAQSAATSARDAEQELAANVSTLKKQSIDGQESLTRLQDLIKAFPNSFVQSQFLNLIRVSAVRAGVTVQSVTSTQPADPGQFDEQGKVVAPVAPVPDATSTEGSAPAPDTAPVPDSAPLQGASPDTAPIPSTPEQEAADTFPLAQISVTISLKGTPNGIERFLAIIATLERPIIIDSLTVGAGVDDSGNAAATATISGRTYLSRPLVVPTFKK